MENVKEKILLIIGGSIAGIANGFFGGGGGMIIVPFMVYLLGKPPKIAHATALLVILPITVFSAITYILNSDISLKLTLPITIGVFCGGLLGAFLLPKLSNKIIMFVFAGIMIAAGIKMVF